jgi:hypothetical protein
MRILKLSVIAATALTVAAFIGCAKGQQPAAAAPEAPKKTCAENQADAKAALKVLQTAMEKYKAAKSEYPVETQELAANGFTPTGEIYTYQVTKVMVDGFVAMAVGQGDMSGDMWVVDQTGEVKMYNDKCAVEAVPPPATEAVPPPKT